MLRESNLQMERKRWKQKKAEYAKKRSEFMKKFDKNGDGKLDEAERKAMKESFGKRMPDKRRRTKK